MNDMPPRALVTGAAKRLGRAQALELARRGFDLAVHYDRSADEAADTVRAIEATGRRAVALRADLAQEAEAAALVPEAEAALGPVGVLVNNAAIFEFDRPDSATRASWDRHMEVNLRAPFVLTQHFARRLPPGAHGLVVNLIDQRIWNLTPNYTSYTVAKVGLWGLTRHLALALAPRIRVNAIGPGAALPNAGMSDADFERLAGAVPLQHGTTPDEIARALGFLLDAPSVTGQMIAIDGGQHLGWLPPGLSPADKE